MGELINLDDHRYSTEDGGYNVGIDVPPKPDLLTKIRTFLYAFIFCISAIWITSWIVLAIGFVSSFTLSMFG